MLETFWGEPQGNIPVSALDRYDSRYAVSFVVRIDILMLYMKVKINNSAKDPSFIQR